MFLQQTQVKERIIREYQKIYRQIAARVRDAFLAPAGVDERLSYGWASSRSKVKPASRQPQELCRRFRIPCVQAFC